MASLFSRIAAGVIPSFKICENEKFMAFLDVNPLVEGHVLVIPKQEVDYLFDMPDDLYAGLWAYAKPVAVALKAAVPCLRVGVAVVGLEVPHAHIHLVPLSQVEDLNFKKERVVVSRERMAELAAAISSKL